MQRKKNRKRQQEKRTQINNKKKIEELKKIRKNVQTDSRGKVKNTKPKLISNIGKNADYGQRKGKIGNLPSDYKKTEKKAFKEAEKYQKKKKNANNLITKRNSTNLKKLERTFSTTKEVKLKKVNLN